MWKRFPVILALIMAVIIAVPVIATGGEYENEQDVEPPTRYGFTTSWVDIASPAAMSYSVATGDLDNARNDDIVIGQNEAISIYTNNGGMTVGFSLHQNVPLTGYYIMDLEIVDYDNDGDRDIIAMGQSNHPFANDLTAATTPAIGSIMIYYIENAANTFTLEDSEMLSNVIYHNYHWYYFDGKFDMACGDFDGDNYIDTVVVYDEDTNGNAANYGERLQVMGVYYDPGSLVSSSLTSHSISNAWVFGNVVVEDFNSDSYDDIIYNYGGASNNALLANLNVQYLKNNMGSFLPSLNVASISGGGFGALPYSMAAGHFSDRFGFKPVFYVSHGLSTPSLVLLLLLPGDWAYVSAFLAGF
ncbi:MAG: FG-GAP-like repeat-containing protein, partial [Thermoplasmatota archaeon]